MEVLHEISGAIIAITLVMTAVFVPVTFMPGPVGTFYRQFGITMATSIVLSGLVALTLDAGSLCDDSSSPTPCRCPHEPREKRAGRWPFCCILCLEGWRSWAAHLSGVLFWGPVGFLLILLPLGAASF